jgi:hypothetical protein
MKKADVLKWAPSAAALNEPIKILRDYFSSSGYIRPCSNLSIFSAILLS